MRISAEPLPVARWKPVCVQSEFAPDPPGVLACKTHADASDSVVWLNRTGTFGIASAAYWFSRLIGLVGRLSFRVLLEAFIFVLIYADDLHLIGAGKDRWLNIWTILHARYPFL